MAPKMTIIIEHGKGGGLEQYYNRASELIEEGLRNAPTGLKPMTMTAEEKALDLECRVLVGEMIKNAPTGKLVI